MEVSPLGNTAVVELDKSGVKELDHEIVDLLDEYGVVAVTEVVPDERKSVTESVDSLFCSLDSGVLVAETACIVVTAAEPWEDVAKAAGSPEPWVDVRGRSVTQTVSTKIPPTALL